MFTSTAISTTRFADLFDRPVPRDLREHAETMCHDTFVDRYGHQGGPIRLGSWGAAGDDDAQRAAALRYLLAHFSQVYADGYTRRVADRFAFVPARGGGRVAPADAYTDAAAATMGFAIADVAPLDALKLQLRAHPESAALVARLTTRSFIHLQNACARRFLDLHFPKRFGIHP